MMRATGPTPWDKTVTGAEWFFVSLFNRLAGELYVRTLMVPPHGILSRVPNDHPFWWRPEQLKTDEHTGEVTGYN